MKTRLSASLLALLLLASFLRAAEPPNIVFIMIDDLGWMDLRVQGNKAVHTPNLDRFAAEGMRFTDAYAAAPVCSPTRAAVLTGQAPARLHYTNHAPDRKSFIPRNPVLLPAKMHEHLPAEHITIAEHLKKAGYTTGFFGKWHLSGGGRGKPEYEPTAQGFDVNIGGCGYGGPPTFFDPYKIPNLPDRKKGEYLPDRLADETIAFMTQKKNDRFLVFLWPYTVHWPMEAPVPMLEKYKDHKGPGLNDPRYGAMIEAMDAAIGRVMKAIDDLNLRRNTLVMFTSDNGGFGGVADNRPLRGDKGHLYEGGIRVPLMVRWPGVVKPGTLCDVPVVSMDYYPTMLEAAGLPVDAQTPLDGESLLPLLRQSGDLKRKSVYFHYPNYAFHKSNRLGGAIRTGNYKLIERFDNGDLELYDLDEDLGERKNLAAVERKRAQSMVAELRKWRARVDANMPTRPPGRE